MKRGLIYSVTVLIVLPALGLGWLLNSESGLHWSYRQAQRYLPESLSISGLDGTLAGPLRAQRVSYRERGQTLEAGQVTLDWSPWGLLRAEFDISELRVQSLNIDIPPEVGAGDTADRTITLPQFELPLGLNLDHAVIGAVKISRGTDSYQLEQIRASAAAGADGLVIENFEIDSELLKLSLRGRLQPTGDYRHAFELSWRATPPSGANLEAEGAVTGDRHATRITQRIQGALQMEMLVELHELLTRPTWQSSIEVTAIDNRLLGLQIPPLAGRLELTASGDTRRARISGRLHAVTAAIGAIDADFELSNLEGERRFEGVRVDALNVVAPPGQLSASGHLDWSPAIRWEADITASRINPAALLPQWPGNIQAHLSSSGGIEAGELVASADIADVQGELRGYPVALQSRLQWKNNGLDIAQLNFRTGTTSIRAEGRANTSLDLRWSLDSPDLAELYPGAQGRISASGELGGARESPRLVASFSGDSLRLPDYEIDKIRGDLAFDFLKPERFRLNFSSQDLSLRGQALQSLEVAASPQRIRASAVAAEARAQVMLTGRLEDRQWRGKLTQADIRTRSQGNWVLRSPGAISLSEMSVRTDTICLQGDAGGQICNRIESRDGHWKFHLDASNLALASIARWTPPGLRIDGLGNVSADLEYRPAQQLLGKIVLELAPGTAAYTLSPDHRERFDYRFAKLDLRLETSGIRADTMLELVNGDRFEGRVALPGANPLAFDPETQVLQANARLDARELGMADALTDEIDGVHGKLALDVEATGTLADPSVKGKARLLDGGLNIPRLKLGLAEINLYLRSEGDDRVSFNGAARTSGGKLSLQGDTILQAADGWPSKIQLETSSVDLAMLLEPWLPEDTSVAGMLFGNARLSYKIGGDLLGEIELSAPSGRVSYPLLAGEIEHWDYRDSSVGLILDQQGIRAHTDISIGAGNTLVATLSLPKAKLLLLDRDRQMLEADARLNFTELAIVEALVPDIDSLRGALVLDLSAGGTLAQPDLAATAKMLDASVAIPRLGLKLEQINLRGTTADDNRFKFQLDARSGQGSLTINGVSHLDATSGWPTTLSIRGHEFEISRIPEATIRVSPDLQVELQARSLDIRGDLLVPYAKLQPRDITQAAQVSSDAVIIDSTELAQPKWQVTTRVNLALGEHVNFFGFGFEGQLGGNLLIRETAGQPTRGTGEINIPQGRYRAYGQRLGIENGRLLFTGGPLMNPGLDIRALRISGNVTAGIHVTGVLKQPRLELFSIPAMGQTDTLSYLLLGRPLESASDKDGAMMAQAALALGLSGGDQIARRIGDRFGLDEMRIESSDTGDQASLVVGRYLLPKLYVSYGIGLIESFNTLNLRYKITNRWQLKAESGVSQGADLMYSFER